MEIDEYFKLIDKYAKSCEDFTIANSAPKHAAYLLKTLFEKAQSTIRIFTGELFDAVYGDKDLLKQAREFLRKDKNNSIRIAYQKSLDIENSSLIQTILSDDQKKGSLKIWDASKKFEDFNNHFAVMDDKAFRFETDHTNIKAIANFGDPVNAKRLANIFDTISSHSSPILEA
jgi:hypothetical protein